MTPFMKMFPYSKGIYRLEWISGRVRLLLRASAHRKTGAEGQPA
jgi:hypothetical protein